MKDAEAVTFATGGLDRASHLRAAATQETLLADPGALCLALWHGQPLLDAAASTRLAWLPMTDAIFAGATESPVFLGVEGGVPRFARTIPDWEDAPAPGESRPFVDLGRAAPPGLPPALAFGDLRATMAELSPSEAGDAAAAKGILGWHDTHRFCARCGTPSEVADAGWRRSCPNCGTQHFPRTDPVVIMLILHGNSVLLGRSPAWPPKMYSLLAGFMEPGESIEAAVRREVREETGIPVGRVDYLSSQPWPFPSSLMIGCRGEALARGMTLDPVEIEDARWVSREAVLHALGGNDPDLRPARPGSIARFLIEHWLADRLD